MFARFSKKYFFMCLLFFGAFTVFGMRVEVISPNVMREITKLMSDLVVKDRSKTHGKFKSIDFLSTGWFDPVVRTAIEVSEAGSKKAMVDAWPSNISASKTVEVSLQRKGETTTQPKDVKFNLLKAELIKFLSKVSFTQKDAYIADDFHAQLLTVIAVEEARSSTTTGSEGGPLKPEVTPPGPEVTHPEPEPTSSEPQEVVPKLTALKEKLVGLRASLVVLKNKLVTLYNRLSGEGGVKGKLEALKGKVASGATG